MSAETHANSPQPSTSIEPTTAEEPELSKEEEENNNVTEIVDENDAKTRFTCDICQVTVANNTVLQRHLKGKKHERAAKKKEKLSKGEQTFVCNYCCVVTNSQKQLEAHFAGFKHRQQVYMSDPLNMSEITYQRIIGLGFIVILVFVIFLCFLLMFKCYL